MGQADLKRVLPQVHVRQEKLADLESRQRELRERRKQVRVKDHQDRR